MKLLFISHCYPWSLRSGTSQRIFHLVKGFAERYQVTLVALHRFDAPPESGFPLREQVRTIEVLDPLVQRKMERFGRMEHLRVLLSSGRPLGAHLWHSDKLLLTLKELNRSEQFDAVWVERYYMAEVARQAGFKQLTVDLDDIETNLQLHHIRSSSSLRLLARAELLKLYLYERTLPWRFSRLVVCSEKDRQFFGRQGANVFVVPNGISSVPPSSREREQKGTMCFIGSLGYQPNVDAALHFHRDVLPKILRLDGDARFIVVGMSAPPAILSLQDGQTCFVANSVPDVGPYLDAATLVVVPLLSGAGTKLKVLEALAHGKAVVSTSIGAEGLDLRPGVDLEIADDAEAFASACVRLLGDAAARRRIADSGRERVLSRYTWERISNLANKALSSAPSPARAATL